MLPGAFGDLSTAELYADRMHQRDQPLANTYAGLRIDDNADRLYGEIDLPNTSYGRDTREEVKTGRLRGLSIAFRAFEDDYIDGVRVVKQGRLYGWGVVDKPAYPQSVAAMRSWAEYRSEYGARGSPATGGRAVRDHLWACRRWQDAAGPGAHCGVAGRRAGTNRGRLSKACTRPCCW